MKPYRFFLSLTLIGFALAPKLRADEPRPASYEKYKVLEAWIGNWTNEGTLDGKKFSGRFTCKWAPGRTCMIWTWNGDPGSSAVIQRGFGIMGWDPAHKKIKEQAFGSDGLAYTTLYEVKGKELHGHRTTFTPDGKKFTSKMIFTALPDRIAIKNLERRDADGKEVPLLFGKTGAFMRAK